MAKLGAFSENCDEKDIYKCLKDLKQYLVNHGKSKFYVAF